MFPSKSRTGLFSVLAFTALAFTVATDLQAQTRTRTGGASGTGSTWSMTIQISDETTAIVNINDGFFDANASTAPGQTVSCTYNDQPALCTYPAQATEPGIACKRFEVGTCSAKGKRPGTRTSLMKCPADGQVGAGCTGVVNVTDLNGLPLGNGSFSIGNGLADINTSQECAAEFPKTADLARSVMGKITQPCTATAPWDPLDPILVQVVRTDRNVDGVVNYASSTNWLDESDASCNPNNGFPTNACTNDGGTWITVLAAEDVISAAACVAAAADLKCGQRTDGEAGPAPRECKLDNLGQCTCRCDRCDSAGTLVNLGGGSAGKFVLSNLTSGQLWAAACEVTVTGN